MCRRGYSAQDALDFTIHLVRAELELMIWGDLINVAEQLNSQSLHRSCLPLQQQVQVQISSRTLVCHLELIHLSQRPPPMDLIKEFHALSSWIKNQMTATNSKLEVNAYALQSTNENLRRVQVTLAGLDGRICQNAQDISAIKAQIDSLTALSSQPSTSSHNASPNAESPLETVAAELQDRLNRSSNILLYNVPVPEGGDVLHEVRGALNSINGLDLGNISARRFTRPTRNGCHPPIIVRLSSKYDVGTVLRNWKNLPGGIQVAADRTKSQREAYKKLRMEAEVHNRNSTIKKRVKYVNGSPVLVLQKN